MLFDLYLLCTLPNYTILTMLVTFTLGIFVLYAIGDSQFTRLYAILLSFIPLFWSLYIWYLYDSSSQTFQLLSPSNHLSLLVSI
jgi:hypothetical protein